MVKLAKCPECGEQFYDFCIFRGKWHRSLYFEGERPEVKYYEVAYKCPNCNKILVTNVDEINKILRSRDV